VKIPYYLIVLVEIWGGLSLAALWGIWYRYRQEVKEVEDEKRHECVFNDVAFSSFKESGDSWSLLQIVYCECGLTREEKFTSEQFKMLGLDSLPISEDEE